MLPRNRIQRHVTVRAGDLVPHELNPRTHSAAQRAALEVLYAEVGFARSLLAYELPDGRLKLIDGHLRAEIDPEMPVAVEVLDVNDAEARALLLAIDPLAQLAGYDAAKLADLRAAVEPESDAVRRLWESVAAAGQTTQAALEALQSPEPELQAKYLILLECEDEEEQAALLARFQTEGLRCKALLS